ncbi:MAG TPA: TfuA-like protein [Micromonosporaceae bacterium]|nr:TfuA-like protein [Micromonosporaceae bacterium]
MKYVFLGPTLGHDAARAVLDAEYRAPAAVGDVYRAVCAGATVILVVDGYFQRVPAVWHKEILYALSRGVAVYGCSSIGALRAVELHRYGMVGVGAVFRAYLAGEIEDDDEVAVAHLAAESAFRRTSEAMVDIRFALRTAAAQGLVAPGTQEWLCAYAKGLFYPDRHWGSLCDAGRREGLPAAELDALAGWVRAARPSVKARDAREALRMLATGDGPRSPAAAPFAFEPTNIWYWLQQTEAPAEGR